MRAKERIDVLEGAQRWLEARSTEESGGWLVDCCGESRSQMQGQRTHLDLITGYQWVWQDRQREQVQKQRADFNSKLRPLAGLVGRGLMRSNQGSDVDLEAVLQTHNLVMANTWSSSTAARAHTFHNGGTRSQLDFLATRRLTVDALAKMSDLRMLNQEVLK
ncbi:unnamed protein product, partial [Symbiodinium necroappetens]